MARPAGSKNVREVATAEPSRCPACDSTQSKKLGRKQFQEFAGVTADGRPYDAICRQRVQCTHCDQVRIDRSLVYTGDPLPNEDE